MEQTSDFEQRATLPDPVDVHVGARVRLRRTTIGMSQEQLGDKLGLTFQQVQKYERGTNRVSASRLFHIAQVLGVEVAYFYDGRAPSQETGFAAPRSEFDDGAVLYKRETLELVRAYSRITNPASRKVVQDLIKSLAPEGS